MNFSAFEYWTDGWDDGILMPRDYGIRRCTCGRFVLRREMTEAGTSEESDAPRMDCVAPEQIDACIATADSRDMEIAARRYRWHHLNHAYREQYRTHRDAEEAALRSAWESENPDRRSFWQRLAGRKAPVYVRPGVPITFPEFSPTAEQVGNMTRLRELLIGEDAAGRQDGLLQLPELYRELGQFADAARALSRVPHDYNPVARKLIAELIGEKKTGPVRFRY
jgi:hypothetical protein